MRDFLLRLTVLTTLLTSSALYAENLLPEGEFEIPSVKGRVTFEQGADPTTGGQGPGWVTFDHKSDEKDGKVTIGLTKDTHRYGFQCAYIDIEKLAVANKGMSLVTQPIQIVPKSTYHIGMWGRIDAKNPIKGTRPIYLKLQVDFVKQDQDTPAGDTVYLSAPIVATKGHTGSFVADRWNEIARDIEAPEDAAFVIITWKVESGKGEGDVSGTIFLDDASLAGDAPVPSPSPAEDGTMSGTSAATGTMTGGTTATP